MDTTPELGMHQHIPPDQYRAAPGIAQSTLKLALTDTEEMRAAINGTRTETDAMRLGTAFHTALVEPGRFEGYYRRWEKAKGKGEVAFLEDLAEARANGLELYRSDWGIEDMVAAVKAHPEAAAIVERPGIAEPSLWWQRDGVLCKARPDAIWLEAGVLIDVKTAKSIVTRDIENAMVFQHYWLQTAWYLEGLAATTGRKDWRVFHVWIKNNGNPTVRVTQASEDGVRFGKAQVEEAWGNWRRCVNSGVWTAYPRVLEVYPPTWALREMEAVTGGMEAVDE